MTHSLGDILIIATEPDEACHLCGVVAELQPWGPSGSKICIECGRKNEPKTILMFLSVVNKHKHCLNGDAVENN